MLINTLGFKIQIIKNCKPFEVYSEATRCHNKFEMKLGDV